MSAPSKQAETLPDSPEDLLRFIEAEQLRQRSLRQNAGQRRLIFVTVALLVVVGGTVSALLFLFTMLQQMPHPSQGNLPLQSAPMVAAAQPFSAWA